MGRSCLLGISFFVLAAAIEDSLPHLVFVLPQIPRKCHPNTECPYERLEARHSGTTLCALTTHTPGSFLAIAVVTLSACATMCVRVRVRACACVCGVLWLSGARACMRCKRV